ncbi:MAG: hypothetical protein U0133_10905 [Gemmatimonadales bacterium]
MRSRPPRRRDPPTSLGWRGVAALHDDAIPSISPPACWARAGSWFYREACETGLGSVSAHHYSPTELGVFLGAECDPERVPVVVTKMAEAVSRPAPTGAP